jgi:hypothetical protein
VPIDELDADKKTAPRKNASIEKACFEEPARQTGIL